jgi:hypothetical protein
MMINCRNCNAVVEHSYCTWCGQKATVKRITLPSLLRDLPHAVFHVDYGFLHNFYVLFRNPGHAIRSYLDGRRKPFYHPASYLVIALLLNYLVVKITDLHFFDESEFAGMAQGKAQAIRDYDALQWWFLEHTYIYILISIPLSALFLYGIFRLVKRPFNTAESAAIVLFTIAQGVLIQTFIYACFGWIKSGPFIRAVETVNVIILISYASWVMWQLIASGNKAVRFAASVFAGAGLAVIWVGSAYLLYLLLA